MESDLPLMELTEEDDSLIQPFPDPKQTPSKSSFNYFNCSPLALPPSRTKSLKDGVHTEKPSTSSSEASNNKENINSNNLEMPKLGMGPIQMKRRKKGAECNLRKSLAWDRAFFTDEGILDPRELNMITGINAYTCGRGLPTISEEGNSSFPSGSRCRNEPNHMETSKEALLKELHNKSRTSKGNKVGNHDSLPHHKITHKVLLTDHSNSNRTRPNSNILRTTKKESKLPKLPMSKLGSCSSTKGSITTSQLRHNLIPKPPINAQKNVGLKSSLKDFKAKTGLDNSHSKELAQKTVNFLTHSSSKATSSTKSQFVHVDKANSGLEMVPDRLHSGEIHDESTPLPAKTLPQYTPTTSVKNNSLPSGLRLPSPSLRFFDQTTATPKTLSGQCSVLNSHTTPCGSPSSNYMVNKGVLNSNVYQDIVRKMQYECISASDVDSHKVIEQEKRILEHKGKMGIEQIALKGNEENREGMNASIQLSENDERVPFILETKDDHISTSVSTSEQSIQHQEHNLLTMVEVGPCEIATEINDHLLVEESGSTYSSTYPQSLDIIPVTIEDEFKNNNENQKHQEMGIIIESMLTTTDRVQAEVSKISFGEEFETEVKVLQETKSPTMLKKRLNNIKRKDNSSIKHPTNAIEAVDEDLVETSKREQSDTKKSNSCKVNHVESQRGEIGKKEDDVGATTPCISALMNSQFHEGHYGNFVMPEESSGLHTTEVNDHISQEKTVNPNVLQEENNKEATVLMKKSNSIKKQDKKDDAAKVVDESSLPMEDDARCNTDTSSNYSSDMLMKVEILEKENEMHHKIGINIGNIKQGIIIHGCDLENSKISFGEEVEEAQVHHELDNGSNLKKNKDATILMKRSNNNKKQDKSLVIHQEDLIQTSKREQSDAKQSNSCKVNSQFHEGHSGNFIVPEESSGLHTTEVNDHISLEKNANPNALQEENNKEATVLMKKSNNIKRQDNKSLVVDAVPFSDEWLAAIEAAGEEILTMKCGAVQHSPPDKSIPERNPWSPVKNKANQIGPYDCTKYTNAMPSNPHLLDS
ncbi:unnamed protein product [Lactuca virosa]|uniref:Uncharacterized protein n=1 Tax=Lactuca virosa TaxID=75947 RepID=A0AAU9N7C8_9ASTR|nr:unnamed protein product [Lactuca virosa]